MTDELPEGWISARIADVFEVNPRKPAADRVREDTPVSFVPMGAVDADRGAITAPEERSFGAVRKGYTSFADGDVLLAKITPCFENGKAAVASSLRNGMGFGSSEFHVFRPQGVVLASYLFHYLRQPRLRADAAEFMTGTAGQARVPIDHISELELPIAPLAEQRRIVAKVEALLEQVRRAKDRLNRLPLILKRFRQAVLAAACEGRLTEEWRRERVEESAADMLVKALELRRARQPEAAAAARAEGRRQPAEPVSPIPTKEQVADLPDLPDGWSWALLPGLGELGRGRSRHRPRDAKHLYGGSHPFIQTGDIARSEGRITTHSQTYSDAGLAQSRLWPSGTVAITIAANIANSAILTYPSCFPDSVVGFIAEPSLCLPSYVEFFVRTVRERLDEFAPATAQKNINLETLREVVVALPPLAEQEEIVRRVSGLFALAAAIEQRVERATSRAGSLLQAILSKAFAGELVPTEADLARAEGRGYETAEQLLERVRKQAMPQDAKKPRGRPGSRRISGSFGTSK